MYDNDVTFDSPTAAMKASFVKGSDLVNMHVFGWTSDETYRNASIVAQLRTMAAPYLSGMQKHLPRNSETEKEQLNSKKLCLQHNSRPLVLVEV